MKRSKKKSVNPRQLYKQEIIKSLKWKRHRYFLIDVYENKDVITLSKLRKGFPVHHLDQQTEHYAILTTERQIPINYKTHEVLHYLYPYYCKDPAVIKRLEKYLKLMKKLSEDPNPITKDFECFCQSIGVKYE